MQEKLNQTHHNTKKLTVIIIILSITTLASLASTVIALFARSDEPEVQEVEKVVYVEVTPGEIDEINSEEMATDPYEDWSLYEDTTKGYSYLYPKDWSLNITEGEPVHVRSTPNIGCERGNYKVRVLEGSEYDLVKKLMPNDETNISYGFYPEENISLNINGNLQTLTYYVSDGSGIIDDGIYHISSTATYYLDYKSKYLVEIVVNSESIDNTITGEIDDTCTATNAQFDIAKKIVESIKFL
jgi:hypothetical protein